MDAGAPAPCAGQEPSTTYEMACTDMSLPPAPNDESPVSILSRREFARRASAAPLACVAALTAACGGGDDGGDGGGPAAPGGNGVTIAGTIMTVPLAQNPTLNQSGGMVLVPQAQALVIRVSATVYQAMTSVCTHQACTVNSFDGARLACPCHGSQFSTSGAVVRGPATAPLRTYPTAFDPATGTITVNLA
jgi:cytochrome b6-f complex iron-sulfur subunit